jgi:hypothetical protein
LAAKIASATGLEWRNIRKLICPCIEQNSCTTALTGKHLLFPKELWPAGRNVARDCHVSGFLVKKVSTVIEV